MPQNHSITEERVNALKGHIVCAVLEDGSYYIGEVVGAKNKQVLLRGIQGPDKCPLDEAGARAKVSSLGLNGLGGIGNLLGGLGGLGRLGGMGGFGGAQGGGGFGIPGFGGGGFGGFGGLGGGAGGGAQAGGGGLMGRIGTIGRYVGIGYNVITMLFSLFKGFSI